MSNDGDEEFLLLPEVARRCRASLDSVRLWIRSGRLPSCRPGRRRLVRSIDLERFLARGAKSQLPRESAGRDGGHHEPAASVCPVAAGSGALP
ncbi:MAG: helix-turn-helix domain-containing protein [Polyangiaceae bacterium]|nr:helix-turn-helix domain-containing protein [Polyangiaceae bacterium]